MDRREYLRGCLDRRRLSALSPRAQSIFFLLLLEADESGKMEFSTRELCGQLGAGRNSLRNALKDLEWDGLIERKARCRIGSMIRLTGRSDTQAWNHGPCPEELRQEANRARWRRYLGLDAPPDSTTYPPHCHRMLQNGQCPLANSMAPRAAPIEPLDEADRAEAVEDRSAVPRRGCPPYAGGPVRRTAGGPVRRTAQELSAVPRTRSGH